MASKKPSFGTPEQKGNVTVYPAAPTEMLRTANRHRMRVAAYVRVSTDSVQQEGSLILQREYYEDLIKNNPEYEFAGIYEDDGITATSVERRKGFLRMMEDCKAGKIDLILTKSISRFARNTGDLLSYANMLNALKPPVEIRFELERISTGGVAGETFMTFYGLFAQEESRTKSESVTWAVDNLYAQGKYYVFPILGYDKERGRNNPLTINEEEAKTVRLCYALAVKGYSFVGIAKMMNALGLKNKSGRVRWTAAGVISLLVNEKYAGAVRARKTVTPNYKTHRAKKNEGEKPQYYARNHHTPIVPPLAYDVTLGIIKNRRGRADGIPCLKAVPEGVLRGFVTVNKNVRGYTLEDYEESSRSVYEETDAEVSIPAKKASIFDLRSYETVSTFSLDDRTKPTCSIKEGKISFSVACRKAIGADRAEILFHPSKAILALRSAVGGRNVSGSIDDVCLTKTIHLSSFVPVALESAALDPAYNYRMRGTRRTKNGENILLFDLRNAEIIHKERDGYVLPDKYAKSYGDGFYEALAACGLHRIDLDGLWQALHESRPTDALAGQIVELTEFCQNSLAEFGLSEDTNNE